MPVLLTLAGCSASGNPKVPAGARSSGGLHAVIETDRGAITLEFFATDAPRAVENFRLLAEHGYYDGLTFHRIIRGFMLQGGDPDGTGTGGMSAWGGSLPTRSTRVCALPRRLSARHRRDGQPGPNTNGSQFFILHHDYPLQPNYVIFARVTAGLEVVDALAATPTSMGDDGQMSRPVTAPRIKKVTIQPHGAIRPPHRVGRCARRARRGEREYGLYLNEPQRRPAGCSARRMPADLHTGF